MQNVRLFFSKTGLSKYISHLDLMRCMGRAIKRANLPVWYTEGYNPHLFMTFTLPLSLGTESVCESVDIRLTEEMDFDEIKEQLNAVLPSDIQITKIAEPKHKATELAFARYTISLYGEDINALYQAIEEKMQSSEILVQKKAKQGRKRILKDVNLKENIKEYTLTQKENTVLLDIILTSGGQGNINPTLLLEGLNNGMNLIEDADIRKEKMYLSDMTEFS